MIKGYSVTLGSSADEELMGFFEDHNFALVGETKHNLVFCNRAFN